MDFVEIEVQKTEGKNEDLLDALVKEEFEDRELMNEKMMISSLDDYLKCSSNEQHTLSLSYNYLPQSPLELHIKQDDMFEFMKEEINDYSENFDDFKDFDKSSSLPSSPIFSSQVLSVEDKADVNQENIHVINEDEETEQIRIEVIDEETIIEEIYPNDSCASDANNTEEILIEEFETEKIDNIYLDSTTQIRNRAGRPRKKKFSFGNIRTSCNTDNNRVLTCPKCRFFTESLKNLKVHLITHTKEKPFKCTLCSYACKQKFSLTTHMLKHTNNRPFMCTLCEYKSKSKQGLRMHYRKHTGEKPYKCQYCDYRTCTSGRLRIHCYTHTQDKPHKCKLCKFQALTASRLKLHMSRHTRPFRYQCTECDEGFTTKRLLKGHMFIHSNTKKSYKCELCPRVYCRSADLEKHKKSHIPDYLTCPTCGYVAETENKLNNHCLKHSDTKRLCCTKCDYSCCSIALLTIHASVHEETKPLICPLCGFKSMKSKSLLAHLSSHFAENSHHCPHCKFICNNQGNYNRHLAKH